VRVAHGASTGHRLICVKAQPSAAMRTTPFGYEKNISCCSKKSFKDFSANSRWQFLGLYVQKMRTCCPNALQMSWFVAVLPN
jgi:hypothetical protein